jgi:hypothetical protein
MIVAQNRRSPDHVETIIGHCLLNWPYLRRHLFVVLDNMASQCSSGRQRWILTSLVVAVKMLDMVSLMFGSEFVILKPDGRTGACPETTGEGGSSMRPLESFQCFHGYP